ncbi:Carboxylic ester hydrolase [Aphelenchoides besseyi]|nr:Carboxylic ester hydrolase [Aphelenchoides besseyi]KAI6202407.1 Carboxylic ester hydrolase [Aphelenchoides besseyi]
MGQISSSLWGPKWTPTKPVQTEQGLVRGKTFNIDPYNVDAYLGIHYARAPTGDLRFKKPEPPESWDGVRDCTRFGARCPHVDVSIEKLTVFHPKSEDCLTLNVFTPHTSDDELLPVAVWIHGGGYSVHSSYHYGDVGICKILCQKKIVVVTIQYRLGFFGFLSMGDSSCPGNFGLWDQTAALRWVQQNIHNFRGDKNNVTVFGQSAGGASTDALHLSPHSRDLFHKMMPMSGSALCAWATNQAENIRELSLHFACQHGYVPPMINDRDAQNKALVEWFRKAPTSVLELSMLGKNGVNEGGAIDLTPVYDGDFFPKPLDELRKEAPPKPTVTGICEFEGLLFTALKPPRGSFREEVRRQIMNEFRKRRIHENAREKLALDLYLNGINREDRNSYLAACLCLISEMAIVNGVWEMAQSAAQKEAPVYLYSFDYCNPYGFGLAGFLFPFKGATHCSELPYLFGRGIIANFNPTPTDLQMCDVFSTLFTNFVKYGNPNGPPDSPQVWEPLKPSDPFRYFHIDVVGSEMRDEFCGRRPLKWRPILESCLCNRTICSLSQMPLDPLTVTAVSDRLSDESSNNDNPVKNNPLNIDNCNHPAFAT